MVLNITYAKPKDPQAKFVGCWGCRKRKGGCDLWKMPIKY